MHLERTVQSPSSLYAWVESGGNPGGYFRRVAETPGVTTSYFRAPAAFRWNLSDALGDSIEFDELQSATNSQFDNVDLVVRGGGLTLFYNTRFNPRTFWTRFSVPLRAGTGWRVGACTGSFATDSDLETALSAVTDVMIRGEYRSGSDTCSIDSVKVLSAPLVPTPLIDMFDSDLDGWWIAGDATPLWIDSDGLPAGCMRGTDTTAGIGYSFVAPTNYLGDQQRTFGRTLMFDFKASPAEDFRPDLGLASISSESGNIAYFAQQLVTGNVWRRFNIPLRGCNGWRNTSTGQPVSDAEMAQVLLAITNFTIRGEFRDGSETEYLDNVAFGACAPSVHNQSASLISACRGSDTIIEVVAGGVSPLTYQWMHDGVPINPTGPGGNPSSTTSQLILADVESDQSGRYTCVVTNECGSATSAESIVSIAAVACCDSLDFNNDTSVFDPQDIEAFLSVYSEGPCVPASATCNDIDFNNDTSLFDPCDIDSFLVVYSEGPCTPCGT